MPASCCRWTRVIGKTSNAARRTRSTKRVLLARVQQDANLDGDPLDDRHAFWRGNYLSTDIRVPLTLVGTNPAQGVGTNGVAGHVWDNFSSDTYKRLSPIGRLEYTNVVSGQSESFNAPGGGVGYYRPATHASLWSTAPYLHNNALGLYLDDPSVKGRLVQFLDGIRRMLWFKERATKTLVLSQQERKWLENLQKDDTSSPPIDPQRIVVRPGDLRVGDPQIAGNDPGFVYRVPQDTYFEIPVAYTRPLIEGVAGPTVTSFLADWGFLIAVPVLLYVTLRVRARYLGVWLVALAALAASLLALTGSGGTPGTKIGVILLGVLDLLHFSSLTWWLLVLGLGTFGVILILAMPNSRIVGWIVGLNAAAAVLALWITGGPALAGLLVSLIILALIWWWNPTVLAFTRVLFGLLVLATAIVGYASHRIINGQTVLTVPGVNVAIGPFPIKLGPIPRGVPLNVLMNLDPDSPNFINGVLRVAAATSDIKRRHLEGEAAYNAFMQHAGAPLIAASKCPDFVLDRGHLFGEALSDDEKEALIAFLKTL